jgi:hypothetical protein
MTANRSRAVVTHRHPEGLHATGRIQSRRMQTVKILCDYAQDDGEVFPRGRRTPSI